MKDKDVKFKEVLAEIDNFTEVADILFQEGQNAEFILRILKNYLYNKLIINKE